MGNIILKQYFIDNNRITIYKKLTIEELEKLESYISEISEMKRKALAEQKTAYQVEGWSINADLHKKIAFLHKYHLQLNDIPVAGLE